jgi:hypothetical protein
MSDAANIALSPNSKSLRPRSQRLLLTLILTLLAFGTVALSRYGWRQSVLFLIGGLFGVSLYHASFGFSSAYRKIGFKAPSFQDGFIHGRLFCVRFFHANDSFRVQG